MNYTDQKVVHEELQGIIADPDGGQHAGQAEDDAQRTAWLEAEGFRVLRFWNTEVLQDTKTVQEVIRGCAG